MLIKEYRIALPMSLEEYQVAQLYMIQKKSREESHGEGSGVEILENRPYSDGPGGCGQYTHKVYHVGSHIPGWFRALLPKAALQVEEESWNAYPYTRTRYTCPFVEKFSIDIETYYKPDTGTQPNVFNLVSAEKRQRIIDVIDIVRDPISQAEYKAEEDPRLYRSVKTCRGPLMDNWIEAGRGQEGEPVMCAYKLCKVEFRYWGMQSKIEQFIHDVGLRRVMLRAHRQAWCWQDEWCDLTMEDIRQLEEETARTLAQRMGKHSEELGPGGRAWGGAPTPGVPEGASPLTDSVDGPEPGEDGVPKQWSLSSRSSHCSQIAGSVTHQSLSEWRMQNIARESDNSSDEEFFDAHEDLSDNDEVFSRVVTRWSSNDFIDKAGAVTESEDRLGTDGDVSAALRDCSDQPPPCSLDNRSLSESVSSENISLSCKIHVLMLIIHGGNILDPGVGDPGSKLADLSTLSSVFDSVTRVHFPEALGHVVLRIVPSPPLCAQALALITHLSPYGYDDDVLPSSQDQMPLAALPLLATSSAQYAEAVSGIIARSNQVYAEFLRSEEGTNFKGQVCIIGDCVGGILGFDALCSNITTGSGTSSRRGSTSTERLSPEILIDRDTLSSSKLEGSRQLSKSHNELCSSSALETERQTPRKHSNSSTSDIDSIKQHQNFLTTLQANVLKDDSGLRRGSLSSVSNLEGSERLEFEVSDFFLFGCPLALVLALRKTVAPGLDTAKYRPACQQIYNLFHPADPSAFRLEPLLSKDFHTIPPFIIPRYQKFPLGDGNSSLLADTLQCYPLLFTGVPEPTSTTSLTPAQSDIWRSSEVVPPIESSQPTSPVPTDVSRVIEKWWGCKRLDYALYCPDALTAFPTVTLPHLFHASYWESTDVVAFILRQVMKQQKMDRAESGLEVSDYCPPLPRGKWLRRRTQVKIRQNVAANHRASDVVVSMGSPQVLSGRFAYGPLDVVTLTGEKVDIYIMTQPPSGKWIQLGSETTSNSGRISCTVPEDKRLPQGQYPVRMFVRGDHTYAECHLSVLPTGMECVVFSIDGSFAASVSIMGSDPKVRAGAVDVVRHWQDRGYLIVYVTGRPDMQKQKVVAWLSQHNFPHGIVSFCDGLVHDPLRQKAAFLQSLVQEAQVKIQAAYGSVKDISVYALLRVPSQQIYIVGRPSKKWTSQCQFLSEGYMTHLVQLETRRSYPTVPANTRVSLAKGCFGGTGRGSFPRPPGPPSRCRSERGVSATPRTAKPRSVSLRFESEP